MHMNVASLKHCVSWEEFNLHCSDATFTEDTLEPGVHPLLWSLPSFPIATVGGSQ